MAEQALCNRLNRLTRRELELLPLLVAGLANKEIARKLWHQPPYRRSSPRPDFNIKPAQPIFWNWPVCAKPASFRLDPSPNIPELNLLIVVVK